MGREIKRVALDFDWPMDVPYEGYLHYCNDDDCGGDGCSICSLRCDPPEGEGWQVWETVSEGSPITPVFPTAEALVDHLVVHGTLWDQKRIARGRGRLPTRAEAEALVRVGWVPSAMSIGGEVLDGHQIAVVLEGDVG